MSVLDVINKIEKERQAEKEFSTLAKKYGSRDSIQESIDAYEHPESAPPAPKPTALSNRLDKITGIATDEIVNNPGGGRLVTAKVQQPSPSELLSAQPKKDFSLAGAAGAIKDIGSGLVTQVIPDVGVSMARLLDDPNTRNGVLDPYIEAGARRQEEYINAPGKDEIAIPFTDITRGELRSGVSSLGFSGTSMLGSMLVGKAGRAAGTAVGELVDPAGGGVPGGAIGQKFGEALGGGLVGYKLDKHQFTQQYRNFLEQKLGHKMTDKEWNTYRAGDVADHINKHALHEAGWEGLGNAVSLGIFNKIKGKSLEKKALKGLAEFFGVELAGEAQTQTGQTNEEVALGMQPKENKRSFLSLSDQTKSAREVLPATMLMAGVASGGKYTYEKGANALKGKEDSQGLERNRAALALKEKNLPTSELEAIRNDPIKQQEHGVTPEAVDAVIRERADDVAMAHQILSSVPDPGPLTRTAQQSTTQELSQPGIQRELAKTILDRQAERNPEAQPEETVSHDDVQAAQDLVGNLNNAIGQGIDKATLVPHVQNILEDKNTSEEAKKIILESGIFDQLGMTRPKEQAAGPLQKEWDAQTKKAQEYNRLKNTPPREMTPEEQAFMQEYEKGNESASMYPGGPPAPVEQVSDEEAKKHEEEVNRYRWKQRMAAISRRQEQEEKKNENILASPETPEEVKKQAESTAQEIVNADPVYSQMAEAKKRGGLNLSAFKADYDTDTVNMIQKRYPGIFSKAGKIDPDEFAAENGYESMTEMVDRFGSAKTKKELQASIVEDLHRQWQEAESQQAKDLGDYFERQADAGTFYGNTYQEKKSNIPTYPASESEVADLEKYIKDTAGRFSNEQLKSIADDWRFTSDQRARITNAIRHGVIQKKIAESSAKGGQQFSQASERAKGIAANLKQKGAVSEQAQKEQQAGQTQTTPEESSTEPGEVSKAGQFTVEPVGKAGGILVKGDSAAIIAKLKEAGHTFKGRAHKEGRAFTAKKADVINSLFGQTKATPQKSGDASTPAGPSSTSGEVSTQPWEMTRTEILKAFNRLNEEFLAGGLSSREFDAKNKAISKIRKEWHSRYPNEDIHDTAKAISAKRDADSIQKDISDIEKRLQKMHETHLRRMRDGHVSRAITTSYAANTGKLAEIRDSLKQELKDVIGVAKADSPRVKTVPTPGANPPGADSNAVLFSDASPGDLLIADRKTYLVKKGIKTKREAEKLAGETGGRVVLDRKKWAVVSDNKPTTAVSTQGAGPETAPASSTQPESSYGKSNKLFTEDAAAKAMELLKSKLNQLNSGLDPEMMQAGITLAGYHIEAGARAFADYSKAMVNDLGEEIKPFLRSFYEGVRYYPGMDNSGMSTPEEIDGGQNATGSATGMEQNSSNREGEKPKLAETLQSPAGKNRQGDGKNLEENGSRRSGSTSGAGLPRNSASSPGARSGAGSSTAGAGITESSSGIALNRRDAESGSHGIQPDREAVESPEKAIGDRSREVSQRINDQGKAEKIKVKRADLDNIRKTLPILFPEQQDDVHFSEQRLFNEKSPERGVMLTNGTGTGKTFSGLGLVKRFSMEGKNNILIVVPGENVSSSWVQAGKKIGLDITPLRGIKDAGEGIVVTSYANFYQNHELTARDFDLLVMDESHKLMENKSGDATSALAKFWALTGHPNGRIAYAESIEHELIAKIDSLSEEAKRNKDSGEEERIKLAEKQGEEIDRLWKEYRKREKKHNSNREKHWERQKTKVQFLSATPFAYEFSLDYAEGFLFNFPKENKSTIGAYGHNTPRDKFYIQKLGYRKRYGKLTIPEAEVNSGLMQRELNEELKKSGAIRGRRLTIDQDYSREFVAVDDLIGNKIDEIFDFLHKQSYGENADESLKQGYSDLTTTIRKRFKYHDKIRILEAIKAKHAIDRIKQHLSLGRKVVVFHSRIQGGGSNPFAPVGLSDPAQAAYNDFKLKKPELAGIDLSNLQDPLSLFSREFEDRVTFYNGTISKSEKVNNPKLFNDDKSGVDIIMVQDIGGKEGISLHDTTGKHQRVLINLGLPVRPTQAIQIEGRIYRVGQQSNAIFEYFNTGTNFERWTFGDAVATRSSTAENLALGEEARALKESFVDAFENTSQKSPSTEQGTGGKEQDAAENNIASPFEKAKSHYFANQKKTSKTKAREGADYFATPEPLGLKMVEWANIKPGEKVLEPSAGHGAIGRYFPESTDNTFIEPSDTLASTMRMRVSGKVERDTFENHHIMNKYDAIVMNPPFGRGGSMAIKHLAKAAKHLKDGGRIVAIIPDGPAAGNKFDKWFYGEEGKELALVGDFSLPSVTFKRAGTGVRARVVIIDKYKNEGTRASVSQSTREYTGNTINDFFDSIEDAGIYDRKKVTKSSADILSKLGLTVKKSDGKWYVSGNTYPHKRAIKSLEGNKATWNGDKKEWELEHDPTSALADALKDKTSEPPAPYDTIEEKGSRYEIPSLPATSLVADGNTVTSVSEPTDSPLQTTLFVPEEGRRAGSAKARRKFLEAHPARIGTFKHDIDTINDPGDAAHVLAPLASRAQETFMVLAVDKNKKPIAVIQHSVGGPKSNQIFLPELVGSIHNLKGVKSFWVAHNHPSSSLEKSQQDIALTKKISNAIKGTGLKMEGHLIMAPNGEASTLRPDGSTEIAEFDVRKPKEKAKSTKVIERRLKGQEPELITTEPITSSVDAKSKIAEYSKGRNGILLMNVRHQPIRFIPATLADMQKMRTGSNGLAGRLYRILDRKNNAVAMILNFSGDRPAHQKAELNVVKFANANGITVLDSFMGGEAKSDKTNFAAEVRGAGDTFLSKSFTALPSSQRADIKAELEGAYKKSGLRNLLRQGVKIISPREAENTLKNRLGAKLSMALLHGSGTAGIDKFSIAKAGSGGGTSFGYGVYLTDSKEVARYFAEYESGKRDGTGMAPKRNHGHRNIYKAEVSGREFVDWEYITQAQKEKLIHQAKKTSPDIADALKFLLEAYEDGGNAYRNTSYLLGGDAEASTFFREAGIDGIKYPVATLTGTPGQKGTNYVIFDEDAIKIIDSIRYSKDGRIEAFTLPDGTVHLVQGNIKQGEAAKVIAHELGVHAKQLGFKESKDFQGILNLLKRRAAKDKDIQAAYDRVPDDTPDHLKDEEALAYLVSAAPEHNLVTRLIAAIKRFLVEHGISERILSKTDLQALAQGIVAGVAREQGAVKQSPKNNPDIRYSKSKKTKKDTLKYKQAITGTENLNAQIGGVKSTTSEEKGQSIIFEILRQLRESGVAGPKEKFSESKANDLAGKFHEVVKVLNDPHKSIAEKQKFAAGFAQKLPAAPRAKLLQKLSQISRYKGERAQRRHLLRFLDRAERVVTQHLRRELIDRVESRIKPTKANQGLRKGPGMDVARGRGPKLERDLKYLRNIAIGLSNENKVRQEVERLQGRIQNLEDRITGAENDKVKTRLREKLEDAESQVYIAELFGGLAGRGVDDLIRARKALDYIFENGTAEWRANQEFWRNRNQVNREAATRDITGQDNPEPETVAQESKRIAKEGKLIGKAKEGLNAISNSIQSWEFMLDKISGRSGKGTLKSWLVDHFGSVAHKATRDYERMNLDTHDALQKKAMEIFGVKNEHQLAKAFARANVKVEGKVFTYFDKKEKLTISPLEAAYWYQISKDATNPVMQKTFEKMGITDKTMRKIEKLMGPKVKAWADYLVDEFYQDFHDDVNEVYRKVYGIDLEKNKNYVPWRRKVTGRAADKQIEGFLAGISAGTIKKGSLRVRVENYLPFRQMNINSVLMSHVADMNHFKAWAIPAREINGTFNDPKIQNYIRQYYGASSLRAIRRFQDDFMKSERDMRDDMDWLDKWRGRVTTALIGANPTIFLKQLTSIPAYATAIPAGAWARYTAYALAHPVSVAKILGQSTMMQARYKKGFERDVANAMRRSSNDMIAHGREIPAKLMVLTALGDKMAIVAGGYAVYRYNYLQNKKKAGYTKERAHKEALIAFEKATERSQQAGNVKDLGSFQRGGPVMKLFTMFMTAPASYSRQVFAAVRNMKADPVDSAKRLFIYGVVLPSLFQAVADAFMIVGGDDDDKERFWKNQVRAIALGPFNGLPIIRDLAEGAANAAAGDYWLMSRTSYSPVTEVGKAGLAAVYHGAKAIKKDDADLMFKALKDAGEVAGYLTGIPVKPAERIFTGIMDSATGKTKHQVRRSIGYSKYVTGDN